MQMARTQHSVRLALLALAVCAVFLTIGGSADAGTPVADPIEYVVESGDTLWGIASSHAAPGADVRRMVSDIIALSSLSGSAIVPGQVLFIPPA